MLIGKHYIDFKKKNGYNCIGDIMKANNVKVENTEIKIGNLFKIVLIILATFGIFYVLTYYLQKNKNNESSINNTNKFVEIRYDEILIGSMLNQKENEYYVLIVNNKEYTKTYKSFIDQYSNGNKIYYSLLDNDLNKKYLTTDSSNLNVSDLKDFKVSKVSLLKVSNKVIVESFEGYENVIDKFIEFNK